MNAAVNNIPLKLPMSRSGFTLIELMVTIAVLAIIVSIAAPSISSQLANQRVKSTTATLANALKEAKVESIIRRQNVTVVYDGTTAPKTVKLQVDAQDIASYSINKQSRVTQTITPSSIQNITFQPDKSIADGATVLYTICDSSSNNETPRQVSLSRIGNIDTINAGSC